MTLMAVLRPGYDRLYELFCDSVICPKMCLESVWIKKIIIIRTVKGLFGLC